MLVLHVVIYGGFVRSIFFLNSFVEVGKYSVTCEKE